MGIVPSLPRLDGQIRLDHDLRAVAADDFGHLVCRAPLAVLLPGSDEDVAATVRWAARHGRAVAAQGQRHSVYGRAQVRGGIAVDMRYMGAIHATRHDRVEVGAGATWREVLAAVLPRGLTPPVLPDYLDLSVGGTLSVAGMGAATARFGAVSDNVLEMRVITGRGEVLTCSAGRNRDLFDAVRAGLGQVAVITRATLRLVPAPPHVRLFQLTYPDLPSMLHDQRQLVRDGRFAAVQGAVMPAASDVGWTYRLEVVKEISETKHASALHPGLDDDQQASTLTYLDYLTRLDPFEKALRLSGQWSSPHPWLMTFVGDSQVEQLATRELAKLAPADLGPLGRVTFSPFLREPIGSPMLQLPRDEVCFAFNLVRLPPTDDPAEAQRLVSLNQATYHRLLELNGALYPASALPMDTASWKLHFGQTFSRLEDAKRKHDPDHVLTPGYEVFARGGPDLEAV